MPERGETRERGGENKKVTTTTTTLALVKMTYWRASRGSVKWGERELVNIFAACSKFPVKWKTLFNATPDVFCHARPWELLLNESPREWPSAT